MTTFEVVLVARVPAQLVAPTLTVVDRLVCETISYTEELNRPGPASLGCPIGSMSTAVKDRLGLLATTPSEAWIYADSDLVWAGEIQTLAINGQTAELGCVGLLGYTYRMGVTSDLVYGGITLTEDFEDTSYNVTPGGTWTRSNTDAQSGSWSLRSPVTAHGATSNGTVTVPTGATSVQFWYKVSSEAGFDFFRFLIAGVQQFQASGDSGWVLSDSYPVSAGQTLTFRYIKDASAVGGSDAAWVDNLIFGGTFSVDQFTIAKGLVDHWQALDYGNYGLVTSGISTSGVLRDRTYLRNELHNVGQRLAELGAVIDGFDIHVNPSTRALILSYPERGTDLSASVFIDQLNIDSASVAMSVSPDDLVTDVSAIGTSQSGGGQSLTIYTTRSNASLRSAYGRSFGSQSFDGVSIPATLEDHADAYRDARNGQLFQPGITIVPRIGCDVGDFGPGDLVTYSYDAGLGTQSDIFRVVKVVTNVDSSGRIRLGVDFA